MQWISFFLRKTFFDFIKWCGGRIDLKFSGVALLSLLYSPIWKRNLFGKGKVPFSTTGYELRAVKESCSVKEIYRWKEDCFVHFMKKTRGPREPSFSRNNQTKLVRKTEDDVFTKEATPERGQNVRCAPTTSSLALTAPRSLARGHAEDDHRIEFSVGDSVNSIERDGSS